MKNKSRNILVERKTAQHGLEEEGLNNRIQQRSIEATRVASSHCGRLPVKAQSFKHTQSLADFSVLIESVYLGLDVNARSEPEMKH